VPEVRDTQEYRRVVALPRRTLDVELAAGYADELTRLLRLPGSTHDPLRWTQGASLVEVSENGGGFLGLPVGTGKTLITYLLATVLGSLRPLLIVPGAGLRDKTNHEFAALRRDWREPHTMPRVVTWQELTTEGAHDFLERRMQPDLIMIDEADEAANADASWVRRIDRYILAHPETVVVLLTGTPGRKSIMNYWHLLCWALRERAPVPLTRGEANEWALALDEARGRNPVRFRPGPLGTTTEHARAWYRTRLAETPGVVIVDGDSCAAPLTVRVRLSREDPVLDREFRLFLAGDLENDRQALETPCGVSVSDPLSRWRISGQYECGLYLRWKYPPPEPWKLAYKAKNAFVRERIAASTHTRKPLDTEAQVLRRYAEHPLVVAWTNVKGTFEPETEAVWLSTSTIESVAEWLAESPAPGIVWTGCVEFAGALSHATRLSYYGRHGRDSAGRGLHVADPTRSMIVSWHSNKKGFNLQPWTRQLLVMPPPSAKWVEQIFGRSHRSGQLDGVIVDWLAGSGATLDLFETVIAEADFARETIGMTQKVLRAKVERATPRITDSNKFRWARKDHDQHTPISMPMTFSFGAG
jgi:hypothetical protein